MGWHYDNLTNKELQRIAIARFGSVLKPLREIGRKAVIEELRKHDEYSSLVQTKKEGSSN